MGLIYRIARSPVRVVMALAIHRVVNIIDMEIAAEDY